MAARHGDLGRWRGAGAPGPLHRLARTAGRARRGGGARPRPLTVVRRPSAEEGGRMTTADDFRELHNRPEPFLLPNPWDAGTARLLAGLGFEALATTSLGVANTHGRPGATGQEILDNCREIDDATPLPVNADLENGFADEPAEAAA